MNCAHLAGVVNASELLRFQLSSGRPVNMTSFPLDVSTLVLSHIITDARLLMLQLPLIMMMMMTTTPADLRA